MPHRGGSPRRVSPLLGIFALLGALAVVAAGALAASPDLRARLVGLLGAKSAKNSSVPVDFTNLGYAAPEKFSANLLARGDMLSYSRGAGLFFVADTSGKVAYLSPAGEAVKSVATLAPAPPPPAPIPDTRVFMTADPQGNVYLSYTRRKVIEKKTPDGRLLLTLTGFEQPEAITLDEQGNLYVVDFNQIKVLKAKPNSLVAQQRVAPATPAKPAAKKPGN